LHWPLPLNRAAACTYMPNASWRRRGVASARGGGSPTLETKRSGEWKGRSETEGCTSEARKPGETPCGREGRSPLGAFAVALVFQNIRVGVAGRNGPAEEGVGGPQGRRQGRRLPPR
jgi:hypothetical protein